MHRLHEDFWCRKLSIDYRPRPWDRVAVPSCKIPPDDSPVRYPDARRRPSNPCLRAYIRNTPVMGWCLESCYTWPWHCCWRETTQSRCLGRESPCPSDRLDNFPRWSASRGDRYSRDEDFLKGGRKFVVRIDYSLKKIDTRWKKTMRTLINQFLKVLQQQIYQYYRILISIPGKHFQLIYNLPLLRGCVIVGDMLMLRPLSFMVAPISPVVAQAAW